MHILITRPQHQSHHLIEELKALGHQVYTLPTVVIEDLSHEPSHLNALDNLSQQNLAIFQSANAVHCSLPHWPTKINVPIIAIGPATAHALTLYGKKAITPKQPSTDGLLTLDILQTSAVSGKNVMLFTGHNPKLKLSQTLHQRQAIVSHAFCYQRSCPTKLSVGKTQEIISQGIDTLVCTSLSTLENLLSMLPPTAHPWLKARSLIVISANMKKFALAAKFKHVHQLNNALDSTLIDFFKQTVR